LGNWLGARALMGDLAARLRSASRFPIPFLESPDVHTAVHHVVVHHVGVGHRAALRQLGNRLVGILHGCLKTSTTYDEATAWAQHQNDTQAAA